MSRPSHLVSALAAFIAVGASSSAFAQTATLEVLVPETVVPSRDYTTTATQYDLRINYAFAGGDIVNPRLEVDLPMGVLPMDLGVFSHFNGTCNWQQPTSGEDAYTNWICAFTSNLIPVDSGGITGQIPIRIRVMPFYFQNGETITLSASFTADNVTATSASADTTVSATHSFYLYPGTIVRSASRARTRPARWAS